GRYRIDTSPRSGGHRAEARKHAAARRAALLFAWLWRAGLVLSTHRPARREESGVSFGRAPVARGDVGPSRYRRLVRRREDRANAMSASAINPDDAGSGTVANGATWISASISNRSDVQVAGRMNVVPICFHPV